MTGRVDGKTILVTGAASGIGLATAKLLAQEGARVILTDLDPGRGEAALSHVHGLAEFHVQDVTQEDRWVEVITDVVARHGRLDGLVNNAGVGGTLKPLEDVTLEEWRFVHAVNADAPFLGCKHFVRAQKGNGGGSIVNVSSVAGIVGAAATPAYSSSKGAIRLLTKAVAVYCAEKGYGIRCNSVHPSFLMTPMVQAVIDQSRDPEKARASLERANPLRQIGEPEDAAALILFLLSDESRFCTGAEFIVDGGLTAR